MKLKIDPAQILRMWQTLAPKPFGKQMFSRVLGWMAPYTGTIQPEVLELRRGFARVQMHDRRGLRNHLKSLHAISLMNLGEVSTGLAVLSGVPKGGRGIITELAMKYRKKARGTIVAVAQVELPTESGNHDLELVAELKDEKGDVVAEASATWSVQIP